MKEQWRAEPRFSLCGLRCALCPMYHISEESHCPGCGGAGKSACAIARCAREHGGVEYCADCPDYPCGRYPEHRPDDSFITYRNVNADFDRIRREGPGPLLNELREREAMLRFLLETYNDGRRKTFYCLAVSLLELADVRAVLADLEAQDDPAAPLKERAALAAGLFQAMGDARGVVLRLSRKKQDK